MRVGIFSISHPPRCETLATSLTGCIGHTMAGSGLKDVLCLVFAPNSVDKMLTGHAYSRTVRRHLLVQGVLTRIILDGVGISSEEQEAITNILCNMEELTPEKIREKSHLTSIQKITTET
ncbi:hypothetical protein AVEN_189107-1 [Araneus ventricosus]|uniref:Uncharacterized protein n=1 Tax=Araneus ventricosus TaxID=182803 RepID=A0A4Y2HG67_ARAVE|nr:hypothetical protein AVEN_189107-1 [Araneus ventricosus]